MPVWRSRAAWIAAVAAWVDSPAGRTALQAKHIRPAAFMAVVTAVAGFADGPTGRNVAATNAAIAGVAGCCPDRVTTVRALLRGAGWAVEIQRGHGRPGGPPASRRPSVWALTEPRTPAAAANPPVDTRAGRGHFSDLPPKGGFSSSTPVGNHSPSALRARHPSPTHPRPPRRRRCAPRPLAVQKLAAALVTPHGRPDPLCVGLARGHIGAVCDALTAAGIDPGAWSAKAIVEALNADMQRSGLSWPDRVEHPGAFLAARLRRLDWRPEGPPQRGGTAAAGLEERGGSGAVVPASPEVVAHHMAEIRAVLARAPRVTGRSCR